MKFNKSVQSQISPNPKPDDKQSETEDGSDFGEMEEIDEAALQRQTKNTAEIVRKKVSQLTLLVQSWSFYANFNQHYAIRP